MPRTEFFSETSSVSHQITKLLPISLSLPLPLSVEAILSDIKFVEVKIDLIIPILKKRKH